MFFAHLTKMIDAGSEKFFTENMLYKLDPEYLHEDFDNFFKFYQNHQKKYKGDLLGLIFHYNRTDLWIGTWVYNLRHIAELTFPWFMKEILIWFEDDNADFSIGIYLATALLLLVVIRSWVSICGVYYYNTTNAKIRNSLRVSSIKYDVLTRFRVSLLTEYHPLPQELRNM